MPKGADAVVKVEDTIQSARPWNGGSGGMTTARSWRVFVAKSSSCLLDLFKFKSIVRSSDPPKLYAIL